MWPPEQRTAWRSAARAGSAVNALGVEVSPGSDHRLSGEPDEVVVVAAQVDQGEVLVGTSPPSTRFRGIHLAHHAPDLSMVRGSLSSNGCTRTSSFRRAERERWSAVMDYLIGGF